MRICIAFLLALAATAQQPDLAVVEKAAGSVGFYTSAGKRIGEAKTGAFPHEIVLSPDRRTLYVTGNGVLWMTDPGEGGNTISILDVRTMKKTGVIDLGRYRRPHGITIHPKTGLMAVTIENPDGLLLIDPAQRKVLRMFDTRGEDPHMVVFDLAGVWAYASNSSTDTVAAIHLDTGRTELIPTDARPQGGVLTRDGKRLYFACSSGKSIAIIDTATRKRAGAIPVSSGPGRIALSPDQRTLVYNLYPANGVGIADIAAGKEIAAIPLPARPMSLTLSSDGALAYAGVQDLDKVFVVSVAARKIVRTIDLPKGAGPDPALPLR
jgi:YVTN family beta-propeller protein